MVCENAGYSFIPGENAYNVQMEVRGQLLKTDYFRLPWDPGIELS